MRFFKYRAGRRCAMTDAEVKRATDILIAHGGRERETVSRPFGPDASITHKLFDFEDSGFAFAIDLRTTFRREALLFHEIDTDNAVFGCAAIENASLLLLSRLGLIAQFSTQNERSIVSDATLAAELPEGLRDVVIVSTRDEFRRAVQDHYARN